MASLSFDLDKIQTIEDFRNIIGGQLGLGEDVSFTTLDIFTLKDISVEYDKKSIPGQPEKKYAYAFTLSVGITVAQDETGDSTQELVGTIMVDVTENGQERKATYGGSLIIPTSDGNNISFDLYYTTKTKGSQTTKVVAGQFNEQPGVEIGNVNLAALVGEISPGLADLFPEELVDEFNLQANLLFVIQTEAKPAATPPKATSTKKMLFGIGFDGNIALNGIPIISDQLTPDLLQSQFTIELLIALRQFDQKELKTVSGVLEEMSSPLKIKAPSASNNELRRGLSIATYFDIGGYAKAWLVPLTRPSSRSGGSSPNRPSIPSNSLPVRSSGDFHLVSSPEVTSPEEDSRVTIAENGAWLNVQKSFGVLHFEKVGLVYKKGDIHLTPQFTVQVSDFSLALTGLSISTPLNDFEPKPNLEGFALSYQKSSLSIGGAFLHNEETEEYLGMLSVGMKTGKGSASKGLSLSAIGSYARIKDELYLFIYLAINYPLGGLPFLFVTGLAGGFGYNRALMVPPLEELTEFPLVWQAIDGVSSVNPDNTATIIAKQLASLSKYTPLSTGAGFLAAGIKFTSFKMLDSFAMLTLGLDESKFEMNILGVSTLAVPTTSAKTRIAVAELVLQARFAPNDGILSVRAQLTENSYILSRSCVLTGGFAACLWFLGDHAGDFVVTLGGYHTRFDVPPHYPDVPRLGFDWQLGSTTAITGQGYFALCSHAVMAGGLLQFRFNMGVIHVSFDAVADFVICWDPYYYDIHTHVKVTGGIGIISVSVGVDLHLWGPDFGGKAKIDLYIVSATIEFGDQSSQDPQPVGWEDFKASFLPSEDKTCSINASDGLIKQILIEHEDDEDEDEEIWVINPKVFALATDCFIPSKTASVIESEKTFEIETPFGVNPMGIKQDEFNSEHRVTITDTQNGQNVHDKFNFEPIKKKAPTGIWGEPNLTSSGRLHLPDVNDEQFIEDVFGGFLIAPAEQPEAGETHPVGVEHLRYSTELVEERYQWNEMTSFVPDPTLTDEKQKRTCIEKTVAKQNSSRDAFLTALGFNPAEVNVPASIANEFIFAPQIKA